MFFSKRKSASRPQREVFRRLGGYQSLLRHEPLEDRRMLALLGVAPQFPITTFDSTGLTEYDATSQDFHVAATPLVFRETSSSPIRNVTGVKDFQINIKVDGSGNLIGGVAGDDLVLIGDIDINGDSVVDVSGVLLTGEISQFGHLNAPTGTTDTFDFRFTPTGGALASYFVGKDIAIRNTSENSNFSGSFAVDFDGGAKGNIGTTSPLLSSLAGNVYDDLNNNGVFDTGMGEVGIFNVTVTLTGTDVDGVAVNTSTTTNASGAYSFANLRPGDYTITETQPGGFLDGIDTIGTPGGTTNNDEFTDIALAAGINGTENNFGELRPASLQGFVYVDTDNDGDIDFGETAIANVTVTLTGTDDLGNSVNVSTTTDTDGMYVFTNLRPGDYTITETQPAGYNDGMDTIGTQGGTTNNDQFTDIVLTPGTDGINNNFGELEQDGEPLHGGQTATIGFWHNKNGQALIKSLNGGATSTQLGNWLATNFPEIYGATAGANNMTGKTNTQVAAYFQTLFKQKGQKLEAQVLATAFAVYSTNTTLAGGMGAASYGFIVDAQGTGAATYNVGVNGAALGVADHTVLTIMQILIKTNERANDGLLWDVNDDGSISSLEQALRNMGNEIFTGINETGGIAS